MKTLFLVTALVLMLGLMSVLGGVARATTTCTFTTSGTTMTLDADCTTDATILVPDGFTLNGAGRTITAEDPPLDHFRGAVVANGGSTAHVKNLTITTSGLANVCDGGADRLRGIMFDVASGSITHNAVLNINANRRYCQRTTLWRCAIAPIAAAKPTCVISAAIAAPCIPQTGIRR